MRPEHDKNCQYRLTKDKALTMPCTCDYIARLEKYIDEQELFFEWYKQKHVDIVTYYQNLEKELNSKLWR